MAVFSAIAAASTATLLAAGGLAVGAVGLVAQQKQAKEAEKAQAQALVEQRKARATEQRRQSLAAARERRSALREARILTASTTQSAVNQGAAGSSAAQGAVSSVGSNVNFNIGFLNQSRALARQTTGFLDNAAAFESQAASAANKASLFGGISSLGFQAGFGALSNAGGVEDFGQTRTGTGLPAPKPVR